MPSQPLFRDRPILCLLIALILFLMPWGGGLQAKTCALTMDVLSQKIEEFMSTATANSLVREQPVSPSNAQAVIRRYLDSSLLARAMKAEGMSFEFVLPGQQNETLIEVLALSYPDEKTAVSMQRRLTGRGKYFKHTPILTRFSSTSVGSNLLVIFTEKSGNKAVVKLVDQLPKFLRLEIAPLAAQCRDPSHSYGSAGRIYLDSPRRIHRNMTKNLRS